MAQNQIKFGVGFNVDANSLKTLKSQLQEIQKLTVADLKLQGIDKSEDELNNLKKTISQVDSLLDSSFNKDLGTLNIAKFNQNLKNSGQTLGSLQTQFNSMGASGANAFRNLTAEILTTKSQVKETQIWLEKMGNTMANTIRWSISSSALNAFTGSIQGAYSYAKKLDESLNNIRIVTEKSADEMERFARVANKAAKGLGASTTSYTDAALIYYQQGLSDAEVQARTDVTLKVANVTGQSANVVSEQLTSVWNGYKVSSEEAEIYIDKLSAVAATTAADLEELSTGMSKVASAANAMGVDIDQLNAQLATIISVTRQAPENVGTALKTIYARMGDLQLGETDDGVTLGDVSSQLDQVGIKILDTNGDLRDMGMVMEEVAEKWNTWNSAQQQAVAIAMAGKRQYNNLLALFENWNMYEDSLQTSVNSIGTLQKQQDIYMESTEAHLQRLKATSEGLYDSLFDADTVNGITDLLTGLVGFIEKVVDSLGGGLGVLTALGTVLTRVFSQQLAGVLVTGVNNIIKIRDNAASAKAEIELMTQAQGMKQNDPRLQNLISMRQKQLEYSKAMSIEEQNQAKLIIENTNNVYKQQDALTKENSQLIETVRQWQAIKNIINDFDLNKFALNTDKAGTEEFEENLKNAEKIVENIGDNFQEINSYIKENVSSISSYSKKVKDFNDVSDSLKGEFREEDFNSYFEDAKELENLKRQRNALKNILNAEQDFDSAQPGSQEQKNAFAKYEHASNFGASLGLEGTAQELEIIESKIEDVQSRLNLLPENFQNVADALTDSINNTEESFEGAYENVQKLRDMNLLSEEDTKQIEKLYQEVNKLGDSMEDLQKKGELSSKGVSLVSAASQKAKKKLEAYREQIEKNKRAHKQFTAQLEETSKQYVNFNKQMQFKTIIQQSVNLISSLGGVVSSIQSLVAIGNIWANTEASFGEKMGQSLTSLLFTIPMVINSISSVSEALKAFNNIKKQGQVIDELIQIAQKESQGLGASDILIKIAQTKAIEESNKQKLLANNFDEKELENMDEATAKRVLTTLGIYQESAAVATLGEGAKKTSFSFKEMGKAAWQSLGPYLPIVLAVAAALGALVGTIAIVTKMWNADAEAAAKTAKNAEALAEAYNSVKATYEDLKNSLSKYEELQDGLDGMIEGTKEWAEVLKEANKQVIELIQKYPKLAQYVENVNGRLTITEEGQTKLLEEQQAAANASYRGSLTGTIAANKARQRSAATDLSRDNDFSYMTAGSYFKGFMKNKLTGGIWSIIEDSINGEFGYSYKDNISSIDLEKVASVVAENPAALEGADELKDALETAGYDYIAKHDELINNLISNSDKVLELSNTIAENNTVNKILTDQIVSSYLSEKGGENYDNYAYKDALDRAYSNFINEGSAAYKKAEASVDAMSDEEVKKAYANSLEMIINEEGKLVKSDGSVFEGYNAEIGRAQLIQDKTFENVDTSVQELMTSTNKLVKNAGDNEEIAKALSGLVGLEKGKKANFNNLTKDELNKLNISNLSLIDAKRLGYNTLEELEKTLEEGQEAYNKKVKEVFNQATSKVNFILPDQNDDAFWGNFSIDETQKLINILNGLDQGGYDLSTYQKLLEGKDIATQSKIAELISQVTWENNQNAEEEFNKLLKDNNIELDPEIVDNFVTQIELMEDTIGGFDIENAFKQVSEINKIISGLHVGDIISEEDYKKIYDYLGEETDNYFSKMLDGTRQLNIDASKFYETTQEQKKQEAIDALKESQAAYNDAVKTNSIINSGKKDNDLFKETNKNVLNPNLLRANENYSLEHDVTDEIYNSFVSFYNNLNWSRQLTTEENEVVEKIEDLIYNNKTANFSSQDIDILTQFAQEFGTEGVDGAFSSKKDWSYFSANSKINLLDDNSQAALQEKFNTIINGEPLGLFAIIGRHEQNLYNKWQKSGAVTRIEEGIATVDDANLLDELIDAYYNHFNNKEDIDLEPLKEDLAIKQAGVAANANSFEQLDQFVKEEYFTVDSDAYKKRKDQLILEGAKDLGITNDSLNIYAKNKYGDNSLENREKAIVNLRKEQAQLLKNEAILEDYNEQMEQIETLQGDLWGQDLINNIGKQIVQQQKLNDELKKQIEYYYQVNQASLLASAQSFGFNNFDLNTTTYTDLLEFQSTIQEKLILNPELLKEWNAFLELFKTTKAEYNGLQTSLAEGERNIISKQLEKLDTTVQIHLDLGQAERDWRDFQDTMARIADDDYLNKYMTSKFNFETYNQGLIETTNALNSLLAKPTLTAEEQEKVKEYQQTIMNNLSEQISLLDEMEQTYLDAVSNISEVTQQQMDEIETVNGLYEHQLSLIELLGAAGLDYDKNMAYENIAANLEEQVKLAEGELARLTDRRARLEKDLTSDSLSEEERRIYEKELDLINESLGEAAETYYSTLESQIENLAEWFNSQVQDSFDSLSKDLFGTDLEWASEEWDMINKRSDQYLDSVNRAYEIKKLENKYLDSIDNASSVTTQGKLNKLMNEELKSLREKDKLSKYEVERANLMYDITLKQIALEEQQRNKSKMRLRRDASGNYSYQFVSDADEIAKVEQELMDLNNELYNLDVENYKDNLNEAVSAYEEYVEKVTKILNDNTLTKKEKEKRIKETTEIYQDIIDGYVSTSKTAYENIATDVSTIVKDQVFGEESKRVVNEFINDSELAFGRFADAVDGTGGFGARISNVIETFTGENGLLATFQTKLDPIVSKLNEAMEKPEDTVLGKAASYLQDIADNTDDIQKAVNAATAVGADLEKLGKILKEWKLIKAEAVAAAEAANKVYKSETGSKVENIKVENIDDLKKFNNFENTLNDIYSKYNNNEDWITLSNKDAHASQMKEENDMAAKEWAEIERIYTETWTAYNLAGDTKSAEVLQQQFFKYLDLYANKRDNNIISKEKVIANEVDSLKQSIQSFAVVAGSLQGRDYAAYENGKNELYQQWQALLNYAADNNLMNMVDFESLRSKIAELKTGGYTGTWGSSGKLAMLHEKELILNKQDTENILSAVDMVRRIASFNSSFLDALEIFANERFNSDMMRDTDNNVLEQHVQIEAHFPNVSDKNEIEEAFNDLINLATQRVNRNIR